MMEANATAAPAGKCDGCGATDVPLMKISLGRDFFGRVYDRLSPSADQAAGPGSSPLFSIRAPIAHGSSRFNRRFSHLT